MNDTSDWESKAGHRSWTEQECLRATDSGGQRWAPSPTDERWGGAERRGHATRSVVGVPICHVRRGHRRTRRSTQTDAPPIDSGINDGPQSADSTPATD